MSPAASDNGLLSRLRPISGLTFAVVVIILALPIFTVSAHLLSTDWDIWSKLWQTSLPDYIFHSMLLLLFVGTISLVIGMSCAWFITAYDFPGRKLLSWALILPLAAPAYIIAYVYADLFDFYGPVQSQIRSIYNWSQGDYWFPPIRTVFGASLILSFVLYPYIYLLARASFLRQSQSQWWAARALGYTPCKAFFNVVLPAARPAIAGGTALVMMETLADFGVADFFAIPTFSVGILRHWLILGDKAAAMKLAGLMLMIVFILVLLESSSRKDIANTTDAAIAQSTRPTLTGLRAYLLTALCALPVFLGFILPLSRLLYHSVTAGDPSTLTQLMIYGGNSLKLAAIVAPIILVLAILLAHIKRKYPSKINHGSIYFATLGYALPGALLAVGLLAPLSALDIGLTSFLHRTIEWDQGLVLTGTLFALIYALSIRFLTVGFNAIDAGLGKIPDTFHHVARSLNATPQTRLKRITFPLLRPAILSALILVFIDVIRELPATLIMRPFNFDTLATRVYWLASDERLAEASTAALIMIGVGLIPTLYLDRLMNRKP